MPHPDFENLTEERIADMAAALAQGKHVQFAGRTATSMEELDFAIEAASRENESAEDVSARAAVFGGPRVPATKADLIEALSTVKPELDSSGLVEAVRGAIHTETQPLRDLAEAILSNLDKDATIRDQAVRIGVLEAENASLRAAQSRERDSGTATLEVQESPAAEAPAADATASPAPTRRR